MCPLYSRLAFAVGGSLVPLRSRCSALQATQQRLLRMSANPKVVCLDCTGTIMQIKGSIPRLYLGALEDRLGVSEGELPDEVSESGLMESFKSSLNRRSMELPCFGAGVVSSEEWWAEVVRATFSGAGISAETLGIDKGGGGIFTDVFQCLYHDIFTSTRAWELVPGAEEVIEDLRKWCQEPDGPLALGAMSNFDERLHPLLKNLGVHDSFDFVLTSRECSSEKPDPGMFLEALKRVGAEGRDRGVIVGDTFRTDVLGARSVGWDAVLVTKEKASSAEEDSTGFDYSRVDSIGAVPAALGIGGRR